MRANRRLRANLDAQAQLAFITYKRAQTDVVTWAFRNIVLPNGDPWRTADRLWQIAIFDDKSRHIVVKKAAQTGLTITFLVKILHYLLYNSATAMYTLPRRDDISDFTKIYLDKLIEKSPSLSSAIIGSDSVRLKQFKHQWVDDNGEHTAESNFHLAEASVEPRMIPVDILANDEIDRTPPEGQVFLSEFRARLENSKDPHHYQFSTPTIPGWGIDRIYEGTTQNEWMVKCPCGYEQVLNWESNFTPNPEPRYICFQCHNTLSPEVIINGKWVPLYPGRDIVGYHISNMMLPLSRPPKSLWKEYESGILSKKSFYNLMLGLAYSSAQGSFDKEVIKDKCFADPYRIEFMATVDGNYYLGADQADAVHVVVVKVEGKKKKIVYAEKIPVTSATKWQDKVIALIRLYRCRFSVIDALPNTHDARDILKAFPYEDRVALCHYSNTEEPIRRDKEQGKVHVQRTEMFDALRAEIADGYWRLPGNKNAPEPIIDTILNHFTNLKRDEIEYDGVTKGVWLTTGPDHFAHAVNYARIATLLGGRTSYKISLIGEIDEEQPDPNNGKSSLELVWGIPDDDPQDIKEQVGRA